jgi:Ulp1 family protease
VLRGDKVLCRDYQGWDVTRAEIQRFRDGKWLDDNCVGRFWGLLQLRSDANAKAASDGALPRWAWFANTQFLTMLRSGDQYEAARGSAYDYAAVARWSTPKMMKGMDVLDMDANFFPVHTNASHWHALRATPTGMTVEQADSLGGGSRIGPDTDRCVAWLCDESRTKREKSLEPAAWTRTRPVVPRQQNG